uniref:Putative secreted protein n=1 Tax=Anopheles triannulatus TaxID=58253 RepID=A0A2M4B687_9DIPT
MIRSKIAGSCYTIACTISPAFCACIPVDTMCWWRTQGVTQRWPFSTPDTPRWHSNRCNCTRLESCPRASASTDALAN